MRKISLIALVLFRRPAALCLFRPARPRRPRRAQPPGAEPGGLARVAAAHYIRHAQGDAASPNIVTVVLADYRGFDTLGETIVVLTAGLVVPA